MQAVQLEETPDRTRSRMRVLVVMFLVAGAVLGIGAAIVTRNEDSSGQELFCHADEYSGPAGRDWERGDGCRWFDADGNVVPGQPDPRCYTAEMVVVSCDDDEARDQTSDDAVVGERH